jgi:hypothetical protein
MAIKTRRPRTTAKFRASGAALGREFADARKAARRAAKITAKRKSAKKATPKKCSN